MNSPAPVLPPHVAALAEQAERLAQQGHLEAAAGLFRQVLAEAPRHARALGFFAMQAHARGQFAEALDWAQRACAGEPTLALAQAQRAMVLRAMGEDAGALEALEQALAIDPGFVPARLDAAALLEAAGRQHDANRHYREALAKLPPPEALPVPLRERVARARASLAEEERALEAVLAARLAPLRGELGPDASARFEECFEIMRGRKRPQLPKPGFMHFPKLAPLTFHPRAMFDWAADAEAATPAIRAELEQVMAGHDGGFMPYVQKDPATAGKAWEGLNHKRDWDVFFLFNQGEKVQRHCDACPATTALLERLPLVRIPGRGPTAFFSRLRPGTHIPPHHGATNTRLIAHLPLVIPRDCAIRVGNDVRPWVPGEMLVFDDTIEHEAWNRSDETRVVLIFDVWNPGLSEAERALVTEVTAAMAEFYPERQHATDF